MEGGIRQILEAHWATDLMRPELQWETLLQRVHDGTGDLIPQLSACAHSSSCHTQTQADTIHIHTRERIRKDIHKAYLSKMQAKTLTERFKSETQSLKFKVKYSS